MAEGCVVKVQWGRQTAPNDHLAQVIEAMARAFGPEQAITITPTRKDFLAKKKKQRPAPLILSIDWKKPAGAKLGGESSGLN